MEGLTHDGVREESLGSVRGCHNAFISRTGDMSNISLLLLSLANCELQAQLRMSGLGLSRDPQQLCNVLI